MKRLLLITLVVGGATLFGSPDAVHAGYGCRNGGGYRYSTPGYSYYAPSTVYVTPRYNSGFGYGYSRPSYGYYSPAISVGINRGYHSSHFHHYGRWGGGVGSANFHHYHHH